MEQKRITSYIDTPQAFERFSQFEIMQGWKYSPELDSAYANIQASFRRLQSSKRAFYLPDVELKGDITKRYARGGTGITPPPEFSTLTGKRASLTDWIVGIELTFPLFEGGAKCARVIRDRYRLRELGQEWNRILDEVSTRVSTSLNFSLASFLRIPLATHSKQAAHKNYTFTEDAYAKGVVTILDLLDAQNTYLVSEQNLATAQFNFALDLFRLMRSVGRFDFFLSDSEKEQWFEDLQSYLKDESEGLCCE